MSHRLEIGLALLLAAAIAVAVWAAHRTPKPPVDDFRASTYLTGPQGSRALYEVLVKLGRPVERRRASLFSFARDSVAPRRPALLVVLNPFMQLEQAELEQVVKYVSWGGAVLAAGNAGGILRCAGWGLTPDRMFLAESVAVKRPPGLDVAFPRVARVLTPRPRDQMKKERLERLVKHSDEIDPCETLASIGADTLLRAVDGRPVFLRLRYAGGGTITLAADVGWFRNRVWRDSDVALFIVPLLASPSGERGRVVWDEYHQGFGRNETSVSALTWEWLRNSPAGWAILQLLAVALVWLAVMAVRFGPARDVIERRRRSPLEHLEALAAGLESAEDSATAVKRLVAGLQRRLGSTRTDLESLELAVRGTKGRAAVRRLRHLINERDGSGQRVLAAAQAVEDVWEELRPRTTRAGF